MKILEKFKEFKKFISSLIKSKKPTNSTPVVEYKVERDLIKEEMDINMGNVPEVILVKEELPKAETVKEELPKKDIVKKQEPKREVVIKTEPKAETVKDIKSKAASVDKSKKMDSKPTTNVDKPKAKKKYKPRTPKSE